MMSPFLGEESRVYMDLKFYFLIFNLEIDAELFQLGFTLDKMIWENGKF